MAQGVIYVLTNPSFPEYVKIGYADNLKKRLEQLNRSECIPFAFRVYCTYEVDERLKDKDVHSLIDTINPRLRSIDRVDGKTRVREFFNISGEEAYNILYSIASISGTTNKIKKFELSEDEKKDELEALQNEELAGKIYTEEMLLSNTSYESRMAYEVLKKNILTLGDITIDPKKNYITFKLNGKNVCAAIVQTSKIIVIINMPIKKLNDPENLARDISNIGHWSTGDYEFHLVDLEKMDYLMTLLKQSYEAKA